MGGGFTGLLSPQPMMGRPGITPVEYADVELGDGRVVRCIAAALVLTTFADTPIALLISEGGNGRRMPHMPGPPEIRIEGIGPREGAVSELLAAIRKAMLEHNVYRGRIVSLNAAGGIEFHAVPEVARDAVVLPDGTLERLEQHALGISEHASELLKAGRHLKRGVLLHGPPGTGKTLTVNYLLTATAGRTTVLLTGGALGFIGAAFAIARDLAPATIVLEDVDLVAAERTLPCGGGGVLFELLNQLEGLAEDADLLVVMTTNRPDVVEPALAARPGRVDLALETPLPDDAGRGRLIRLYAREIALDAEDESDLVSRTDGVTGAFIKELMRQATLRAATAGAAPTSEDVGAIAGELLHERAALTRRLLGEGADGDPGPLGGPPLPAMVRAVGAAGLAIPPGR
jgi:SpoVK/Ycf46/Vps4 family AAA+-type ATPase